LALLSKESAVVFLPLLLLGDYARGKWKTRLRYALIGGITLVYLGVLWKAQGGRFGQVTISQLDNPLAVIPAQWRILNSLRVAWKYAALHFYPAKLSCDYSFNTIPIYLDWRHTLPALLATLAAVGGGWVTQANQYGRWLAVALLGIFGLTLLLPSFAERLMRPLVSAGNRLSEFAQADGQQVRASSSFLLGIATGLLWAPCAGPILGLVLTGAALRGASVGTTLLLVAYAAGAATSLAVALLIGGRVFAAMKRSLGAGEWIRRGIGAAMLLGVVAISLGLDTGVLARVSTVATGGIEQKLVDRLCSQQEWLSLPYGMFEQPLIGTVERLSPMHSHAETQAEGALSSLAASGLLPHSSSAWPSSRVP